MADSVCAGPGQCCGIGGAVAVRCARVMSAIGRVPNAISLARKATAVQDCSRVAARRVFTQQQVMNGRGDDGASRDGGFSRGRGYDNRFRGGRGRYRAHAGDGSASPLSRRDEYRHWLHAEYKPPVHHERFVIASYNILADQNVQEHWRELYWHIPPFIMDWDARKRKLLRELGLWSPDIICLQEVDRYDDFNEGLQEGGYVGVYTARTGGARDGCAMFWRGNRFELLEEESIYFKDHNLRDNVAQLCVLQTKSKAPRRSDTEGTDGTETTIPGSCDFRNNRVVVGNIHVLFSPRRGDVKLGQIRILMEKALAISEKWGNAPVAIGGDFNSTPGSALYQFISSSQLDLACHDRRDISGQDEGFPSESRRTSENSNNAPRCESNDMASGSSQGEGPAGPEGGANGGANGGARGGAEEKPLLDSEPNIVSLEIIDTEESVLVTTGEGDLATEMIPQKASKVFLETVYTPKRIRAWFEDELMVATGGRNSSIMQHKLNLRSAYSEIEGKPGSRDERGEPLITTFHKKFRGTVDYIWHTGDLCTVRVLDTLPTFVLEQCRGLPSKKWGSDHLALACEFSFVPREEDTRQNGANTETNSESG